VPVDEELAAVGRATAATPEDVPVYESHLFGLDGGRLLLVYIVQPERAPAELRSAVLRCAVKL